MADEKVNPEGLDTQAESRDNAAEAVPDERQLQNAFVQEQRQRRMAQRRVKELERQLTQLKQRFEERERLLRQALGLEQTDPQAVSEQLERLQREREELQRQLKQERLTRLWFAVASDAHDPELALRALPPDALPDPDEENAREQLRELADALRKERPYLFKQQQAASPRGATLQPQASTAHKRTYTRSEIREMLKRGVTQEEWAEIEAARREGRIDWTR